MSPKDVNLLRSAQGKVLLPEICLLITEYVIDIEPKSVVPLLVSSKSFYTLLKSYEVAITKSASARDSTLLAYIDINSSKILSSLMPPGHFTVSVFSFAWFSELRCRMNTVESLISHRITEMSGDATNSWPTLNIPKVQLLHCVQRFKRASLILIYQLADCAAGLTETIESRVRQSEFLEGLSVSQLASLGTIVEIIGQGYFTVTKNTLLSSELGLSLSSRVSPGQDTQSRLYIPTSVPINDVLNDNWIRECMCVFEDKVQRYGPYFAWAYMEDFSKSQRRPDLWAIAELQEGLDNMNAFELGYTMSFASLQSVVWKVFCKKVECSLQDSWTVAKEMVESEMAGYVDETEH